MEDKNKSQNLLGEEEQESSDDSLPIQESLELNSEQKKELDLRIGTYEEAEKFIQDNEYIKGGYLLNCTTFKKTFKSLLIIHNESVNVWSHLIGAIFSSF